MNPLIRSINSSDVAAVASIHAASWRSAYRGILLDEFLDDGLDANRMALWESRLSSLSPKQFGCLAFADDKPVGFAFAFGEQDAKWGTLIDNLHVLPFLKGRGLGKQLLANLCEMAAAPTRDVSLYLWVYEQNTSARRFYESIGGESVERAIVRAPDGQEVPEWRYAWQSVSSMLSRLNN